MDSDSMLIQIERRVLSLFKDLKNEHKLAR